MTADSAKKHDSSQAQRFIETARSLDADEDEATFKAKLAVIVRHKTQMSSGSEDQVAETGNNSQKRGAPDEAAD